MEPARGGQAGREEKGKENEQDRTKNKPKEVHREVSNGKNTRGQDKTEGWEMGSSGTNKAKKMRRRGAGGGRGEGGRGREEGSRGGGGGRKARGNKTAKRRSFNEEAGKPKHANET